MTPASSPAAAAGPAFKTRSLRKAFDLAAALGLVARRYGKSPWRQAAEILPLMVGKHRLTLEDYYAYGLFRPGFTPEQRRSYVSLRFGKQLNQFLSPAGLRNTVGLFTDKVLTALLLRGAGVPALSVLAVLSARPTYPGIPHLADTAALERWLRHEAPYPVFGKPVDSSLGIGGASLLGCEDGHLRLGSGAVLPVDEFARQVAARFPGGYMLQPLVTQHPAVAAIAGTAVSMLRVTTLRQAAGPRALYAAIRLPPAGAMVDTYTGTTPDGIALVDLESGRVVRGQSMWAMNSEPQEVSLATGLPLAGHALPDVPAAARLCEQVHAMVPGHGVLGFDVALTPAGPFVNEINANPHHPVYQRAADRGLMNPDFAPRIADALAETERLLAADRTELRRIGGKA